ncbi:MAG: FAD-dependent oxidoreductase [Salinisphaera sp.]|jgi:gamma-glutamylputrescine oxidase|nr:FAD-dependent oxidoreductase [Salinisphaera sp.]
MSSPANHRMSADAGAVQRDELTMRDMPHAKSYYAESAHASPARPALAGRESAHVCVIGAGFSGLSTALTLAERGYRVIVLEAARVGWGASGRNGGQIVNGYSRDLDEVEKRYGEAAAKALGDMAFEGGDIIRERIARYDIDCDLREGGVFAALNKRQMAGLKERVTSWARFGHSDVELLDEQTIRQHSNTDLYIGGLLDKRGGHVHPLNLALGEAVALEGQGGIIHEHSRVIRVEGGARPVVYTEHGQVHADYVVACGNAYLGHAVPALRHRVMPVSTQVIATEPLGAATARRLMPAGSCVEDCNYMLDYYRMSADNRLLFGGGSVYGGTTPANITAKLRPHMARTFPEIADVPIDYAWSGNFALTLTRIPHLGQLGERFYFTHGYSGHGVTTTHLAGRLIGEAINGERARFEAFAALRNYPFPGGRMLRVPLSVLGSWYYQAREKLGL